MSGFSEIMLLRKSGRLKEAYDMAVAELDSVPSDVWLQMALFWVLRDICLRLIENGENGRAEKYMKRMSELLPTMMDDQGIGKRSYEILKKKFSPDADRIIPAAELSKTAPEVAFDSVACYIDNPRELDPSLHEYLGWILYRYLKSTLYSLDQSRFSSLMNVYMGLSIGRPSMLHSMMMALAVTFGREHRDYPFVEFLASWGPENFSHEDYHDTEYNGRTIPSLVARVCKFLASCPEASVGMLSGKLEISDSDIVEYFREGVFWNLINQHKDGNKDSIYDIFDAYADEYSSYGGSYWHSEILKLAVRYMEEQESWRFLPFFRKWGYWNLQPDDFRDTSDENGNICKSLAVKAAKKCFGISKGMHGRSSDLLEWLSAMFDYIVPNIQQDEWISRQRAIIHFWGGEYAEAADIFRTLLLKMSDKYYIWSELAECVTDDDLKLSLLCKSLMIEKNEDFIGNIRLSLAEVLIRKGMISEAASELGRYCKGRERLSSKYESLSGMIPAGMALASYNMEKVYKRFAQAADEYVYSGLPEHILTVTDMWESGGRKFCVLNDGRSICIKLKVKRFPVLSGAKLGESFRVRCNLSGMPVWLVPEKAQLWQSLPEKYGVVEYLNEARKILHIVTSDSELVFCPFKDKWGMVAKGDFVVFHTYYSETKDGRSLRCAGLRNEKIEVALAHFPMSYATVDNVNDTKRLFHITMGTGRPDGVVFYDTTELRPQVGDRLSVRYCFSKDRNGVRKLKIVSALKEE